MFNLDIPISRAALSIRPMEIQKEAASLRRDYQKSLKNMLEYEDIFLLAKRLHRKYPNIIKNKYGARPVSISSMGWVTVHCLVKQWSDAAPIVQSFQKAGYESYNDPTDDKYSMTRKIRLGVGEYETKIFLLLALIDGNEDCVVIVKEYITSPPHAVHEIVCNEMEAKLKTDMGGAWSD